MSRFAARCLVVALIGLGSGGREIVQAAVADTASTPGRTSPNVLFILADDLGVYDLSCYGRSDHRTPHLDQLAAEGLRFTSAYCAQPICSASRAALMTGKAPARLRLTCYLPGRADCSAQRVLHPVSERQLPLSEVTLAETLRALGYATGAFGKWHLGGNGFQPTDQGFAVFQPGAPVTRPSSDEGSKGEFALTALAERFLEDHRHRPFFLFLAHDSPHIPYAATSEAQARFADAFEPTYAAVIADLDAAVGRLLRKLDVLGLRENTLVIFTSDNGGLHVPELGHARVTHNGPFRAGKGFLYEGGLRIPLLVRWPGKIAAGRVSPEPVVLTDWFPTLVAAAGGSVPAGLDGVDIAPILLNSGPPPTRALAWHFPHYTNQGGQPAGAWRDGAWKLIEHYDDGRVELFRLDRDPGEQNDLSEQNPRRARRLKEQLANWRRSVDAQTNALNPRFDATAFARLYVEFAPSRFAPAQASAAEWQRAAGWRKEMDAAVTGKFPANERNAP